MPLKYGIIKNATDFLDELEKKRLNSTERESLNQELIRLLFKEFIKDSKNNKLLLPYLQKAKPVSVARIQTRDKKYYVIQFANNTELVCSHALYNSSPLKKQINRLY